MPNEKRTTTRGTPCAQSWTDTWIATIETTETDLNHRICGARLPDATPCPNESDHPSGRCKFHGGCDLIGAPPGNRNAAIHGIYSRRLRTCTDTCPYWNTCPVAAERRNSPTSPSDPAPPAFSHSSFSSHSSLSSLNSESSDQSDSAAAPDNPKSPSALLCPYQLIEYNTVITDALAIAESAPHPSPMGIHAAHNVAMLQVLISSAAAQLANGSPSTDANPNAVLAFVRLMREFRASLKLLASPAQTPLFRQKSVATPPTPDAILRHVERMQHDTQIDPDSIAQSQFDPDLKLTHAKGYLLQAVHAASQGRDVEMAEAFDNAARLDEPLAESEHDHVLACYRPLKQSVSEELAAHILGNLHLPPLPEKQQGETPCTQGYPDAKQQHEDAKVLKEYLDIFRDGKVPPEAFPLHTPIRAYAEQIYNP